MWRHASGFYLRNQSSPRPMAVLPTMRAVFSSSWASWSALAAAVVVAGCGFAVAGCWLVADSESAPIGLTNPFLPVSFFESGGGGGGGGILIQTFIKAQVLCAGGDYYIVVVAHYLTNTEEQVSWGHDKTLPKGKV